MWYKISNGYMYVSEPSMPSEYQEVEYIESSWTQVIKTWVYMDATWYRATLEYQNTSTSPSDQAVFWYYMNSEAYAYRTWYWTWNENFTLSKWATSLEKQTATWSWTTRTNSNYQFYIFAKQRYDNGNYDSNAYCKLYSCKIYNSSDELIRDFVPCYRKSDNIIWLYDKVGWEFYTNQWSWTFTKWNDVEPTYIFVEKQFYPWVPPTPPGPPATEIYYDLRWWSLNWLTAAWFNWIYNDWSYQFYSDWLWQTSSANDRNTYVWTNQLDLSSATKVTIESLWYWMQWAWSNWKWLEIRGNFNWSSDTNPCFSWSINLNTDSPSYYSFNGLTYVNSSGSASNPAWSRYASAWWDTTITQVWDLVNKTWTLTFSWANSNSFNTTLSDAQVAEIKACKAAKFWWWRWYSSYNGERLKTVYIKIEY